MDEGRRSSGRGWLVYPRVLVTCAVGLAFVVGGSACGGNSGTGPARPSASGVGVSPLAAGATDPGDDDGPAGGSSSGGSGAGGSASAAASSAKPGAGAGALPADLAARIPHFDPAPPVQPVTVPAGPQAGWYSAVPTSAKVAFLTIDDGQTRTAEGLQLFQAAHVPVTLFLTTNIINADPDYFRKMQAAGAEIQAHTITHTQLKGKPYEVQKREACGSADRLGELFGRRPIFFRPPYGDKDATTLKAVHDCGMKAAFFWKETVNTGTVRYQKGNKIEAGDIVLMHFRPAFVDDFLAALKAMHDAGLTPALLSDYVR